MVNGREVHKVLDNDNVKKELKALQKCFVLVPIDKASNNIAFVCKQHYASVIRAELGYPGRSMRSGTCSSPTYSLCTDVDPDELIENQVSELDRYGLEVEEEMKSLPRMYWSPIRTLLAPDS